MSDFKTVEVKGFTKKEALDQAPFQILRDATQAWKKAGSPVDKSLKEFCANYLEKHTKFSAGIGCSITIEAGSADTREKPYTIKDIKNEKGKRKWTKGIQGVNAKTGEILFTSFDTKTKVKDVARDLYVNKGFRGDIKANYIKAVTEGEVGAFEVVYTPSKGAKMGSYLCFGVEA